MSNRREEARLRRAAETGDAHAAVELGRMLDENGDVSGAVRWYRLAATSGDIDGAVYLGLTLCDNGNWEEGAKWLKMAANSNDPEYKEMAELAAGALGRAMLELNNLDEAERWLKKAVAAGVEMARNDLEELQRTRSERTQGETSRGSGDEVLQTFEVRDFTFYDGSEHRLGPSTVSLTRRGVIIDDARGGVSQILLRDIQGVRPPSRIGAAKLLRVTTQGVAYDFWCKSKAQRELLEDWLVEGVRYTASGGR
jgi:tetratricopeptide (TPR) repeat protein